MQRKRGRPPIARERHRARVVGVRLTEEEHAAWSAAAELEGRALGAWIRRQVVRGQGALVSRVPIPPAPTPSRRLRKP